MKTRFYVSGLLMCAFPGLMTSTFLTACADPCIDDGLTQVSCPEGGGSDGSESMGGTGATDSSANSAGATDSASASGSASHDGADDASTGADGDGEALWCVDNDGDGFGDPDDCQPSDEPVAGSVDNSDDCDDSDESTFPGAAPHDSPDACMRDADGDDWGDDSPPAGVEPGTDCLDSNEYAFPGAAESEVPADLCAEDEDEDGWGDDEPPPGVEAGNDCADDNPFAYPGVAEHETPPDLCALDADGDGWGDVDPDWDGPVPGNDCYDSNPDLNPSAFELTTLLPVEGDGITQVTVARVETTTASLTNAATLDIPGSGPNVNISTATINEAGEIVVNDLASVRLYDIEYGGTCMATDGDAVPLGPTYGVPGDILCGVEFSSSGALFGIDHDDNLLTFAPHNGQIIASMPIQTMGIPLNINGCGMAYDCAQDRLLVANGVNKTIYSVDPATGVATNLRDLTGFIAEPWNPVGLEYDLLTHHAYISTGSALYEVAVDSDEPPVFINAFSQEVSNLQYLPLCES